MKPISGQIIVRNTGERTPGLPNTQRLVMVVGILAVPAGEAIKGEHQYNVSGAVMEEEGVSLLQANIDLRTANDLTERIRGWGLGSALTAPIWRV